MSIASSEAIYVKTRLIIPLVARDSKYARDLAARIVSERQSELEVPLDIGFADGLQRAASLRLGCGIMLIDPVSDGIFAVNIPTAVAFVLVPRGRRRPRAMLQLATQLVKRSHLYRWGCPHPAAKSVFRGANLVVARPLKVERRASPVGIKL